MNPRYAHEYLPRSKDGKCKQIVGGESCHLPEEALVHQRWKTQPPPAVVLPSEAMQLLAEVRKQYVQWEPKDPKQEELTIVLPLALLKQLYDE
jgi:hypothetical protein